jgi:hypothetical protein
VPIPNSEGLNQDIDDSSISVSISEVDLFHRELVICRPFPVVDINTKTILSFSAKPFFAAFSE